MVWIHGTYTLNDNSSLTLNPFSDGYQQVQDPCAAESNFIEQYNNSEIYQSWRIFQDVQDGYKLHLFQFDGAPVAPQFLVSTEPNMLPTRPLRNESSLSLNTQSLIKTNDAASWTPAGIVALVYAVVTIAVGSFVL